MRSTATSTSPLQADPVCSPSPCGSTSMKTVASLALVLPALVISTLGQVPGADDGRQVLTIANDRLTLGVRIEGGAMARLVLNDDPAGVNAMHAELGHFVCVDGFGPVSAEERTAGLPGHGEAHRVPWQVVSSDKGSMSFAATLP